MLAEFPRRQCTGANESRQRAARHAFGDASKARGRHAARAVRKASGHGASPPRAPMLSFARSSPEDRGGVRARQTRERPLGDVGLIPAGRTGARCAPAAGRRTRRSCPSGWRRPRTQPCAPPHHVEREPERARARVVSVWGCREVGLISVVGDTFSAEATIFSEPSH